MGNRIKTIGNIGSRSLAEDEGTKTIWTKGGANASASRFVTSIPWNDANRVTRRRITREICRRRGRSRFDIFGRRSASEADEDHENPSPPVNPARVRLILRDYVTPQCLSGGPETPEHFPLHLSLSFCS